MNEELKIIRNFLEAKTVININIELDKILSNPLLNGFTKGSVYSVDKKKYQVREVFLPIKNINSINMLELAIKIHKILFKIEDNMILTNLMVNSEKGNSNELKMHTDNRTNLIRATIYLNEAGKNSGGFFYVRNSSKRDYYITHEVDEITKKKLKKDIVDCSGNAGDIIMFDSYGFHGKHRCMDERRTIIFEFQKKDSSHPKASININNLKLSKLVMENLHIFFPGEHKETYKNHGSDVFDENYLLQKNYLLNSLKILLKSFMIDLINKKKRIERFIKKKLK